MPAACEEEVSISSTLIETVYHVMPMHANPVGTLHGGVVLEWMTTTSTMAANRLARGPTVVAGMDHVFFINPIRIGENAIFTSWVNLTGRTSMEVTTVVEAENPVTGERRLTTIAHTVHVAVDDDLRPRPLRACVRPANNVEERLHREALERRRVREARIRDRRERARDVAPPRPLDERFYITSYRFAYPEDAVVHNAVFAGKLLYYLDELAGIIGLRYARGPVVTAAVDATDFYSPIRVGESIEMHAALTYVGRSSIEVTLKVIARNEATGEARHTTTSYFTVVHVGIDGKPRPVPPLEPREQWQRELHAAAQQRRSLRLRLLREMRERGVVKPLPGSPGR